MSALENDDPAFPVPYGQLLERGMSLRDYFAAKAPAIPESFERKRWTEQQVIDKGNGNKHVVTVQVHEPIAAHHARWAFEYADAMLAERAK